MADGNGSIVNPAGNEGHSVETAADDFTAMLAEEGKGVGRPRRREDEEGTARQSPASADAAGSPDAGQSRRQPSGERGDGEEGEGDDPLRDDLLDGDPDQEGDDPEADDPEADDQDDDDQDDEDDDQPEDELDAEYEVKVNGEVQKVKLRDALASYQMEADYRQKTERNAREYDEIQDYAKETVQTRLRTDNTLQAALDLIGTLQPTQEDWAAMKAANPQAYIEAQEHWNGLLEKARAINAAREALFADQARENERAVQRYLETQERELLTKMPMLRDEKKANSFRQTVMAYGKSAGYSDEELEQGATDHRAQITLYKAAMYDRLRENQKAAGKKASAGAPKNSAEGRPKPRPPRNGNRNAVRNADRRLQRTGSVQDAAASFAEMIRSEA
jgi:hypothetical protein